MFFIAHNSFYVSCWTDILSLLPCKLFPWNWYMHFTSFCRLCMCVYLCVWCYMTVVKTAAWLPTGKHNLDFGEVGQCTQIYLYAHCSSAIVLHAQEQTQFQREQWNVPAGGSWDHDLWFGRRHEAALAAESNNSLSQPKLTVSTTEREEWGQGGVKWEGVNKKLHLRSAKCNFYWSCK